jgi:UDP-3-O-[3-hydroxymyristoyl] glucosamine N-acyltransferase
MIDYRVHKTARIGRGVTLGPFVVIGPGVTLGDGVTVEAGAIVGRVPVRGLTARDPGEPGATLVGAGSHIGAHAVIYTGVTIGARCLIGDHAHIREGCALGDGVRLATHVSINYETIIGDETQIMQATHITGRMRIGRRCFFGPLVACANHREPRDGFVSDAVRGPTVGDGVLVGAGAILCPGVMIGDGATVGAGALVTRDVDAGVTVFRSADRPFPTVGNEAPASKPARRKV